MKEDSRNYAWVAVLVIGLLIVAGGAYLFFGGSSGPLIGSSGLTPVAVPPAVPAPVTATPLEEPADAVDSPAPRVRATTPAGAPPDSTPAEDLRLTVAHADGTPAHGALCALVSGAKLHDLDEADAEGRCTIRGLEGAGELIVLGVTVPTFRRELQDCRGELSVALPAGAVVSGLLLVDGAPPTNRTIVMLDHWEEGLEFLDDDLRWQSRWAERESEVAQPVTADGSFRFSGLPEDWSGDLDLSRELWLEEGGRSLGLDKPQEGLVLRATRRPRIQGRVLLPDGETPAPYAILRMELSSERATRTWIDAADAEGLIEIGILGAMAEEGGNRYDRVQMEIYDVEREGYIRLDVTLEPLLGKDLGDIVLRAARDVPFLAVDDVSGEPVEGAVAYSGSNRAEPTDREGRSVLHGLRPDRFEFQVLSIAHADTTVPVPLEIAGETLVRLERATTLEVLVSTLDGSPVPGLPLCLQADCALFGEEEPTHPSLLHIELGASDSGNSSVTQYGDGRTEVETNFETDEHGRCLLVGIDPECTFSLSVDDGLKHPLYREAGIELQRGQLRRIEIVCPQASRTLRGTVLNELGQVIAGARLFARSAEIDRVGGDGPLARRPLSEPDYYEDQGRETTDTLGRWVFSDLFAPRVDLLVTAEGYETLVLRDVPVPQVDEPFLELIMRKSRSLAIRVRAGEERLSGRLVSVSAFVDGWRLRDYEYADGAWTFTSPPDHELVLIAHCAQRWFHRFVLPTDSEIDWELPALGSVHLNWKFSKAHPGGRSLQLIPLDRADEPILRWISEGEEEIEGSRELRAFAGRYEAVMFGELIEGDNLVEISNRVPVSIEAGEGAEPVEVELRLQ